MKISRNILSISQNIISDVKIDTITEDIAALVEDIQSTIDELKTADMPIVENEILNRLRYKGFIINPIVIKSVEDAIQLELEEAKQNI